MRQLSASREASPPRGSIRARSPRRLLAAAGARVASGFGAPRLSVLFFHRVLRQPDPLRPDEPDAEQFARIADWLATYFRPVSLSEGLERLDNGTLPSGAVCVTFDDGYEDNLSVAAPICRARDIPLTLFVASGYLDGGIMWNDLVIESIRHLTPGVLDLGDLGYGRHQVEDDATRLAAIGSLLGQWKYLPMQRRSELAETLAARSGHSVASPMLARNQVSQLANDGIEIGGHTVSHPILAQMDAATARQEIADNKDALEGLTGRPLKFFAYPNGLPQKDFNEEHESLVKRLGYQAALSTESGVSSTQTNRYCLPRFTPWDRSEHRFVLRTLLNTRHAR